MKAQPVKPVSFDKFGERINRWYRTFKARSTAEGMARIVRHVEALEIKRTDQLDADLVAAFVERRREQGRAENTILGELGRLKALCNLAVRWHLTHECPFVPGEVLVREETPRKLSHLAKRQLNDLVETLEREIDAGRRLDAMPSWRKRVAHDPYAGNEWRARRLQAAVFTWMLTGARKCEVLYCWKEDLDLEADILKILSARKRLKTKNSERRVPVVAQLHAVLEGWLPFSGPSVWLLPGARMTGPWVGGSPGYKPLDQVKAVCKRAGIEGGHIHLFRHTWLTHAESWGIPELGAQKITGITQKRTLGYYVHTETEQLHTFVRGVRLPELLAPQPN